MAKRTLDVLSALAETIEGAAVLRTTRIERAIEIEQALKSLSTDSRLAKIAEYRHEVEEDVAFEASEAQALVAEYDRRMVNLWADPTIQDQLDLVLAKVGKGKSQVRMDRLIHSLAAYRMLALYLDNTGLVYAELAAKVNALRKAHEGKRGVTRRNMAGLRLTIERDQARARVLREELKKLALTAGERAEVKAALNPPKPKAKVVVNSVALARRMMVTAGDEVKAVLADHGYKVGDEDLVVAQSAGAPLVIASLVIGGAAVPMKVRVEGEWQKDLARRLAQYS